MKPYLKPPTGFQSFVCFLIGLSTAIFTIVGYEYRDGISYNCGYNYGIKITTDAYNDPFNKEMGWVDSGYLYYSWCAFMQYDDDVMTETLRQMGCSRYDEYQFRRGVRNGIRHALVDQEYLPVRIYPII